MISHTPPDPHFETRVRASFARQKVMGTIGARLSSVLPGEVTIELPVQESLTQQHGFVHAGIVTTIVDSACGYAAFSLMPADAAVLTVEYKVNFLSPAVGDVLIARGRVTKAGRTLTICSGDVFAVAEGREKLIATMLATIMTIRERMGLEG
ncbi:MAG: thioesterase superfamily protein [Herpetosiphonaceae bacterium]|nr:MAG: thioesterase superfamily protein [Herpetosiphonaceae bacterium]